MERENITRGNMIGGRAGWERVGGSGYRDGHATSVRRRCRRGVHGYKGGEAEPRVGGLCAPIGSVDCLRPPPSAGATVGFGRPRTDLTERNGFCPIAGGPYRHGAKMKYFSRLFLGVLKPRSCWSVVWREIFQKNFSVRCTSADLSTVTC
jgi:hypothetical protein